MLWNKWEAALINVHIAYDVNKIDESWHLIKNKHSAEID